MENQSELDQYIGIMAEIKAQAEALAAFANNHGGIAPDDVNWSHIADATEILDNLRNSAAIAAILNQAETLLEDCNEAI